MKLPKVDFSKFKIPQIRMPRFDFSKFRFANIKQFFANTFQSAKKNIPATIIFTLLTVYIVNGIVFGVLIYKHYPDSLENGKKYPYEIKTITSMTKIYPFVATLVNWKPIYVKDYYEQLNYIKHFSEKTEQAIPANSELEKQVMEQMIELELVNQQAKKYNIKVTNDEVNAAYQKIVDENQGEKQVKDILKELYNMTEKQFKKLIYNQLLAEKIKDELPVKVRARHILVKDENLAKEITNKARQEGANFEDLVKEYSEDTGSRDKGGDLDWFGRGTMVKEFEDAVFAMEVGKISDPVKSQFGFHIIKLEEKKGKIDKSYLDWMNELIASTKIYRFIDATK